MLIQAPSLAFPDFTNTAAPFLLQTDASAVGLGAVVVLSLMLAVP